MKNTSLIILDGVGINNENLDQNAINLAKTPNLDKLFGNNKYSKLEASGREVGVSEGYMGNSEVGHITIGSGRIIKQSIIEINDLYDDKKFQNLDSFKEGINNVEKNNSGLHLIIMLGKAGIHAHISHLRKTIRIVPKNIKISLHLISDGRDSGINDSLEFINDLNIFLKDFENVTISSLSGRYYAMDRDNNLERTRKVFDIITTGNNKTKLSVLDYIKQSYENGITDEFIEPIMFEAGKNITKNDSVFFLNFRSDRAKQLTRLLEGLDSIFLATMTRYYKEYKSNIFLEKGTVDDTLGEVLQDNNLKQLHLAETEKYAHVTKFFNGSRLTPFLGEDDILIPSHKVATYDLDPEMSANEIYDKYEELALKYDFCVVNFANGDMVGHTGNKLAAIKAVEALDSIVGKLINFSKTNNTDIIITADHGNCEEMSVTSHTLNLVPCFYINSGESIELKKNGGLKDIAPTILDIMQIKKPALMTGNSLIF